MSVQQQRRQKEGPVEGAPGTGSGHPETSIPAFPSVPEKWKMMLFIFHSSVAFVTRPEVYCSITQAAYHNKNSTSTEGNHFHCSAAETRNS
jgi:hypothetical protein